MIEINNFTTNPLNEEFLKKIGEKILEAEEKKMEISLVLVGRRRIKTLNKKYRQKNKVTDVLSFSYNGSGEVVICLQEVKKNAKRYNLAYEKELTKVLIHGLLHLLGYDHEVNPQKAGEMKKKEEHYLSQFSQS